MFGGVGCDGGLHLGEGDVLASHQAVGQRFEGLGQSLAVHRIVAVHGAAVALGCESLADGAQVILEVHLHHLEDSLALQRGRGAISPDGHRGSGTDVSLSVACYVCDTVDGTAGFTARTDLFDLSHVV